MKKYVLQKSEIHNFGIFKGTQVIDFDPLEVIKSNGSQIIGVFCEYDEDKEISNRGGKSLFLESIEYNLTGKTRKSPMKSLINNGEDMMYVKNTYVNILNPSDTKTIRRGCDIKGSSVLELDWNDKTADVKKEIEATFGIGDDFSDVTYFKQNDIHEIMNMKTARMAEFLAGLFNNQHWENYKKKVEVDRNDLQKRLTENETRKRMLEESVIIDIDAEVKIKDLEKEIKSNKKLIDECDSEILAIDKFFNEINSKKKEIREIKKTIEEINEKIARGKTLAKEIKSNKSKIADLEAKLHDISESYEDVISKLSEAKSKKNRLSESIKNIKNLKGVCPVLNKTCDLIDAKSSGDVKSMTKEVLELENKIEKLTDLKNKIDDNDDIKTDITDIKNRNISLKAKYDAIKVEDNTAELDKKLNKLRKEIDQENIHTAEDKLNEYKHDKSQAKLQIDTINKEIGKIQIKLEQSEKSLDQLNSLEDRNKELRSQIEDLNWLMLAFGKYGIPADEIDNGAKLLEQKADEVISRLIPTMNVEFHADRETQKWEPLCVSCGVPFAKGHRNEQPCTECGTARQKQRTSLMNFKIIEDGNETDFELDSGGGKTMISIAIRIAIALLKRDQGSCNLDMIILDEIDKPFDKHYARKAIDLITKYLTNELGFSQILIISHNETLKNSAPQMVKVTRHIDKRSSLSLI